MQFHFEGYTYVTIADEDGNVPTDIGPYVLQTPDDESVLVTVVDGEAYWLDIEITAGLNASPALLVAA